MSRRLLLIFSCVLLLTASTVLAYSSPGSPAGFVNDYADLLRADEKRDLENKLTQFNASSSNELAIVTIKSLEGDTIENFANQLFADWKIGQAKKDNGVLLLVALNDRKMRIETGYGLEGALPDATANQIITKTLRPAFQANNYYEGINKAADQIIAATYGEYQAEPVKANGFDFNKLDFEFIFSLGFVLINVLVALWRYLAKSSSWWQGGLIGLILGLLIALLVWNLLILIALPLILGGLGLLADFLVSRVLPKPKALTRRGNNFWFFGGPGGFGRGGGSGGGFGGFGGGGSGGGGSSGGW